LKQNFQQTPIWHNPLAVLILLARECGRTSEIKRQERDDEILSAEIASGSSLRTDPSKILNQVPKNYFDRIKFLHICSNTLAFIDNAVAFEIEVWNFLRHIITVKDVNSGGLLERPWIKADRQFITNIVYYEIWRIKGRKLQIVGLQDRVKVQQSLVRIWL
jgi:hypothetical protein